MYRDPSVAASEIPVLRALLEPAESVRTRAERLAARIGGTVVETVGRVGGGALPLADLPSFAVALLVIRMRSRLPCASATLL